MTERVLPRGRGLFFEEFREGDESRSPARTITESDIVQFAALSSDWNPLHTDAEFAAQTPFGARIAHGLLGLSIASGLVARLGRIDGTAIAFRGIEDWKFTKPIFIGDTVHVVSRVAETKALPRVGGGQVVFEMEVVNHKGEACQRGRWALLVRSRPAEA